MRERGPDEERPQGLSQAHRAGELQRTAEVSFALVVSVSNAGIFSLP